MDRSRLILLLIPVFLFASAAAQPISGRLDSLRVYVLDQANVNAAFTNTVSQARVTRAINRACAKVSYDFPAVEKLDTIYLVDSTDGVALNTDFIRARSAYQVRYGDNEAVASWGVPMTPVNPDSIPMKDVTGDENRPRPNDKTSFRYFWTYADRFFTQPQWSATTDSIRVVVSYYAVANRLDAASDTTLIQPEYREKVILYAVSLVKMLQGLYDESQIYLNRYYAGIRGQGEDK